MWAIIEENTEQKSVKQKKKKLVKMEETKPSSSKERIY